jgi:transcriptional regulator with XRE-family HTH domain
MSPSGSYLFLMNLSTYLKHYEIPSAEFARRIGVRKQTIYKYINGICFPSLPSMIKIKHVTNGLVTTNDFSQANHGAIVAPEVTDFQRINLENVPETLGSDMHREHG